MDTLKLNLQTEILSRLLEKKYCTILKRLKQLRLLFIMAYKSLSILVDKLKSISLMDQKRLNTPMAL